MMTYWALLPKGRKGGATGSDGMPVSTVRGYWPG